MASPFPSIVTKSIELRIPDIPLWVPEKAQQQVNALLESTLRLALQEAAGFVSDSASDLGVVDQGHLAQSFGAMPANADGGIEVLGVGGVNGLHGRVFSSLPYAIVMEEGRRPGAPISREGIDAIGLWAQRKLGLSGKEADGAKWAIAHAIVARGIEGRHFAEKGFNKARPRIETMFEALGTAIAKSLTTSTGSDIVRQRDSRGRFIKR